MLSFREYLPVWLMDLSESLLTTCDEIYLVGGAIRNLLGGAEIDDYDFVVKRNAIDAARQAANLLIGDFYILDHHRQTARAIITAENKHVKLDFALFNGKDIIDDLTGRDFTINAMALRVPVDDQLLDPTGGAEDIREKKLKPCSDSAFTDDPVRTIRFVRFLQEMDLKTDPKIENMVNDAVPLLGQVSKERQRDALLDVISTANLRDAFNYMLKIGLIYELFPGADHLKDVDLSLPHTYNAWDHTMQVMHYCQQLMAMLGFAPPLAVYHPRLIEAFNRLDQHIENLRIFFQQPITDSRTKYQLLILSAFFHDLGKTVVKHNLEEDRKRFPGHAKRGAKLVRDWSKKINLSNKESDYLYSIVRMHMKVSRPELINDALKNVSVYRFFKRTGEAGVLTAILHLADVLATYENAMTDNRWDEAMTAAHIIFDAYFVNFEALINPTPLVNGRELIQLFGLQPGKQIGSLLDALQEEQVSGNVQDRQQALAFIQKRISKDQEMDNTA
jgi:poly(A) polymerase